MPPEVINPSIVPGEGPKYDEDSVLLEQDDTSNEDEQQDQDDDSEIIDTEIDKSKNNDEDENEEDEEKESLEDEKPVDIPFDRPTVKEIKAEFPDFFKKFPQLKDSYFREIEFTKLFPTIEDAEEAFQENEAYTTLSESALSGDPIPLLESIERSDKRAYELFSMSFLPSLYKKDQALYAQTVNPLLQNLVRNMAGSKDENTKNAGYVVSEFLFGNDGEDIASGKKSIAKSIALTEEQKQQKDQRENSLTSQFRKSAGSVGETINKSLESLIIKNPSYDPNKVFSPFLRKQGAEEVRKRVMKSLESDRGHMAIMAARWKRARANGYTSDDESKIVSTYLARAKSLISNACSEVSAAMMGSKIKTAQNKSKRLDAVAAPRRENNSGRTSSSRNGNGKVDYKKMSDMEILES